MWLSQPEKHGKWFQFSMKPSLTVLQSRLVTHGEMPPLQMLAMDATTPHATTVKCEAIRGRIAAQKMPRYMQMEKKYQLKTYNQQVFYGLNPPFG